MATIIMTNPAYLIENNNIIVDDVSTEAVEHSAIIITDAESYNVYLEGNSIKANGTDIPSAYGIAEIITSSGTWTATDTVKYGHNQIEGYVSGVLSAFTRNVKVSDCLYVDVNSDKVNGTHIYGDLWVDGVIHNNTLNTITNYLTGFQMSKTNATDILITAGQCTGTDGLGNDVTILLTTPITKKIINVGQTAYESWVEGDSNGGVAGAVTNPSLNYAWVHCFVIMNNSGTVDIGFDTSISATNLLSTSSYTYYRRIGSIKIIGTSGSYEIRSFIQTGDVFTWYGDDLTYDFNNTNANTAAAIVVSDCPLDVPTIGKFGFFLSNSDTNSQGNVWVKYYGTLPTTLTGNYMYEGAAPLKVQNAGIFIGEVDIVTNISSTLPRIQTITNLAALLFRLWTKGYVDLRGKE